LRWGWGEGLEVGELGAGHGIEEREFWNEVFNI
jgi:hypothetical protein